MTSENGSGLSWWGIVRLGLVQTAFGSIIVMTTSTINRVMVVELGLLAALPALLVGWHYAIQIMRPRWGHASDVSRRRTPWIVFGMGVLALGGVLAAFSTALFPTSFALALTGTIVAFTMIGVGVGAAGTALLALLATLVSPSRRPASGTIVWLMMIAGIAFTAGMAGKFLDPFSLSRLVAVTAVVCAVAFCMTCIAVYGLEDRYAGQTAAAARADENVPFREALKTVWSERQSRYFTVFVFVSMLAYNMQELILEPFAGLAFGYTPGQSTSLASVQHQGVFFGMLLVGVLATRSGEGRAGLLRRWIVGGCLASAVALAALAFGSMLTDGWPLGANVFCLGFANGVFAVAAISSMMGLAGGDTAKGSDRQRDSKGVRMGLWGAAQAFAFGLGGIVGATGVDVTRQFFDSPEVAFGIVFAAEAALFVVAAGIALRLGTEPRTVETQRDDARAVLSAAPANRAAIVPGE